MGLSRIYKMSRECRPKATIWVSGFKSNVSPEHLKVLFQHFGFVTNITLKYAYDALTQTSRKTAPYVLVTFLEIEDAIFVQNLSKGPGITLDDHALKIQFAFNDIVAPNYDCHVCQDNANHSTEKCPQKKTKAFCLICNTAGHEAYECRQLASALHHDGRWIAKKKSAPVPEQSPKSPQSPNISETPVKKKSPSDSKRSEATSKS